MQLQKKLSISFFDLENFSQQFMLIVQFQDQYPNHGENQVR